MLEKSPREQREQRKKWREASKKYRAKTKEAIKMKPVTPEVVVIKTSSDNKDNVTEEAKDPLEKPQSLVSAKIRRIKYLEQKRGNLP